MTDSNTPHFDPDHEAAGHEPLAVKTRGVVTAMIGLAVLIVLAMLLANLLIQKEVPATDSDAVASPWSASPEPPTPRVTPQQSKMYREMLAEQKRQLTKTIFLDRKNNIAQIPLDRAMQLLETEGFEAFERLTENGNSAEPNSNKESEN